MAGTQAAKVTANNIVVFRMSNLHTVRPLGKGYVLRKRSLFRSYLLAFQLKKGSGSHQYREPELWIRFDADLDFLVEILHWTSHLLCVKNVAS